MSEACHDCLDRFQNGARRFGVLKVDTTRQFSDEEILMSADVYAVTICADCAGWYGDDAVEVTEES